MDVLTPCFIVCYWPHSLSDRASQHLCRSIPNVRRCLLHHAVRALIVSKLGIGCVSGPLMDSLLSVFSGAALEAFRAHHTASPLARPVLPDVPPSLRAFVERSTRHPLQGQDRGRPPLYFQHEDTHCLIHSLINLWRPRNSSSRFASTCQYLFELCAR